MSYTLALIVEDIGTMVANARKNKDLALSYNWRQCLCSSTWITWTGTRNVILFRLSLKQDASITDDFKGNTGTKRMKIQES